LTSFVIFGVGWRFFAIALDVGLQGRSDTSVIIALFASVFAALGLPLAMISPNSWLTDFGFVAATVLTTGWFLSRVTRLWGKKLWKQQ
ncbi:MAG TPA: hypothetical protein VF478_05695, partial [Anaerolineae bacterium]